MSASAWGLDKCPFCGGKSKLVSAFFFDYARDRFSIICEDCGASTKWYDTEQDAVNNWNKWRDNVCNDSMVRCKDCRYSAHPDGMPDGLMKCVIHAWGGLISDKFYCGDAVKWDGER